MQRFMLEFPDNQFGDAAYYLHYKSSQDPVAKKAWKAIWSQEGRMVGLDKARLER